MLTPMADDPKVPIHLLMYACQTGITTMTCIAEYLSWESFTNEQKLSLSSLYVPYLALCKLIAQSYDLKVKRDEIHVWLFHGRRSLRS